MADTCIVCLGDLLPHDDEATPAPEPSYNNGSEFVAHLLPCGHDLHNECLKPWVERANSCPICRASFNLVELRVRVGGMSTHGSAGQGSRNIAVVVP